MNKNCILLCLLISTPVLAMEQEKKEPGVEWVTTELVNKLKNTISQQEKLVEKLTRERDNAKKNYNKKKNSTRKLRKQIKKLQDDLYYTKRVLEIKNEELSFINKTKSIAGIEIKHIHEKSWFRLTDNCSSLLMLGTMTVITVYILSHIFPEPNDSYYEAFKNH